MRRLFLSTFVLASTAVSALADDLTAFKGAPAPEVLPAFWTGAYVGAYGGGVFGSTTFTGPIDDHYNQSPHGGAAGGLVGYNAQYRPFGGPDWVAGIEGEGGWQGFRTTNTFIDANSSATVNQTVDTSFSARVRGRLGYAFSDRALLFVAGGLAFSDISATENDLTDASGPYTRTRVFVGGTIGGGVDFAFTPNWIGRIEYIYDNYPGQDNAFSAMNPLLNDRRISSQESTVRAALIYKFGSAPAPIVAKY
jgi:outer membrane immunogenic protein